MNDDYKEMLIYLLFGFSMIGSLQLSAFITIVLFPNNIIALVLTMHLWSMFAMNYNRFFHRSNYKQLLFGFFLWELFFILLIRELYRELFHKEEDFIVKSDSSGRTIIEEKE